jgi:formylglycine-generating enzyme required for sulfatase activity
MKQRRMTMTDSRSLRVFLCHASDDKPAVGELYRRLQADGFDPWLDEANLLPGQNWPIEIPKAVRNSHVVIVCLSRHAIAKPGYIQKEIKFALDVADEQPEDTIFLIPLKLEECNVPDRLSRWQWVNLFSPNGYERLMRALRVRAESLGAGMPSARASAPTEPHISSKEPPASSDTNVSGGINVDAERVNVGKDMVAGDKVIHADTYIEHAVIVQSPPQIQDKEIARPSVRKTEVRVIGGLEFVLVPAGKFIMGSKDDNKLALDWEKPQYTIEIPYDYWIARYPVTNEQFAKFVEATKYKFDQGKWQKKTDHPVVRVSWHEAMAYCKWLNDLVRGELQNDLLRLPTEAEWEKAAHGEFANEWPWGDEFGKSKCNSDEDGKGGTTSVGRYSPQGNSPYGAADMAGNVWEWCHSLWKPYPYKIDDGRESESSSQSRVLRGGSFLNLQRFARAAFRNGNDPRDRLDDVGFHVVIAPPLK